MITGNDTRNTGNTAGSQQESNQQQYSGTQGGQHSSQQQYQQQGGQRQQPYGGMRGLMGRFSAPMSSRPSSEILSQLMKVLQDEYATVDKLREFAWTLIPIDYKATTNLNASAILVALSYKDQPNLGVGYHALILASDSSMVSERDETFQGQTYPVQKFPGDLVDRVMTDHFADVMKAKFPGSPVFYADACTVPQDFDLTDKQVVRRIAANAVMASWTEVQTRQEGFRYLNLALMGKDPTLQVRTNYNQPPSTDALGQPVRTDVTIDFRSVPQQQSSQYTENVERVEVFAMSSGFMELTFDPVVDPNSHNRYMPPPVPGQGTQLYSARFVLTQLESQDIVDNSTQLLALATTFPLLDRSNPWMTNFLPRQLASGGYPTHATSGSFDPRDIGALNYEAQMKDASGVVDRINTEVASFTHQEFYALMNMLVRDGIALAIDIPECGDSTWYNRIFMAARDKGSKAYATLITAAQELTNGNFGTHWDKTSQNVLFESDDRVHLGWFIDSNGVKTDVRTIDLLYLLNRFGANDPTIGRQWTETFTNASRPPAVNMAIRRKMIEACVAQVTFTGTARRCTFHTDFTRSLDLGTAAAGLAVKVVTQGTDSRSFQRASSGLSAGGALNSGFHSSAFDYSYGGGGNNYGYRGPSQPNRW